MSGGITRDEWLKALGSAAQPEDPDAKTVDEIAAEFRISRPTAYRRMVALVEAGQATATFKFRPIRTGGRRRVPAYRLVTAKPKKATR